MLNALIPVAAATLTPLAHSVGKQIEGMRSFLDYLHEDSADKTQEATSSAEEGADEKVNAFTAALRRFHERAVARLSAAGVDLSLPVEIALNTQGQLSVTSAHPDLAKIENVLNSDADLPADFAALAQQQAALRHPVLAPAEIDVAVLSGEFAVEFDATNLRLR